MGDKILGIISLAVMGAILGDALKNYQGTSSFLNGLTNGLTTVFKGAGGAYSG